VHTHPVPCLEGGDTAQLRALDAVDYSGHGHKKRDRGSRRASTGNGSEGVGA
jgi:hypothetical protein